MGVDGGHNGEDAACAAGLERALKLVGNLLDALGKRVIDLLAPIP